MSSVAERRITPDEYLRRERSAEAKSEYDDGVVYAMSGASPTHNLIVAGLIRALGNNLPQRCRVFPSDMKVRMFKPARYYYPDVTVVCGEMTFEDDEQDVLSNPLVIFEALSESTEHADRARKFQSYLTIDSLGQYVLVWHDAYVIESFTRETEGWHYSSFSGLDTVLPLAAAACEVPLRDIYYQVQLEA